jgi:hypothetical protein
MYLKRKFLFLRDMLKPAAGGEGQSFWRSQLAMHSEKRNECEAFSHFERQNSHVEDTILPSFSANLGRDEVDSCSGPIVTGTAAQQPVLAGSNLS